MVAPWVLQIDYRIGIEDALAKKDQQYLRIKKQETFEDFHIAYIEGYEAGQRQVLEQLILEDPK